MGFITYIKTKCMKTITFWQEEMKVYTWKVLTAYIKEYDIT